MLCKVSGQVAQEPGANIMAELSFGWTFARKREF
jgi:hypothetical protein